MVSEERELYERGIRDDVLAEAIRSYRKRARMTRALFGEFCGLSDKTVARLEMHLPAYPETIAKAKEYLANAPKTPNIRAVKARPKQVYLTQKLLVWAKITGMSTDVVDSARAIRDAYDKAKRDEGLASVPLIQLEVENALTLATRGAYYRRQRG